MSKEKRVIVLLGCMDSKKPIMRKRWNASFFAIEEDTVFIVSGLPNECQYYRNLIDNDYGDNVFYDEQATDTLSNAEGVARLIRENHLEEFEIFCRLSRCHMWRFKKCLKMVGLKNKMNLKSSKRIPEAHNEWMAVCVYLLGPWGIRLSNRITKKRRWLRLFIAKIANLIFSLLMRLAFFIKKY